MQSVSTRFDKGRLQGSFLVLVKKSAAKAGVSEGQQACEQRLQVPTYWPRSSHQAQNLRAWILRLAMAFKKLLVLSQIALALVGQRTKMQYYCHLTARILCKQRLEKLQSTLRCRPRRNCCHN